MPATAHRIRPDALRHRTVVGPEHRFPPTQGRGGGGAGIWHHRAGIRGASRGRHRGGVLYARPLAHPGPLAAVIPADCGESATGRGPHDPKKSSDDLPVPRHRKSGWIARLRAEHPESLSSDRSDGAQGPARCESDRVAGGAADTIPTRGEFADREAYRHHAATRDPAARRRGDRVKRRTFISLLGGAGAAWPLAARGQKSPLVVGFLGSESPTKSAKLVRFFHQGLAELGFVEGQNLAIEYRWANGHNDQLPALAADLVRREVNAIAAPATTPGALAAKAATETIPIVIFTAGDPVELGLVASLSRPGGNITGTTSLAGELAPKRLELMRELIPKATVLALLVNPTNPVLMETTTREAKAAADTLGAQLHVLHARTEPEFERIFATLSELRASGLVIAVDSFFTARREQLGQLALRHRVPAIYQSRDFAEAGGVMSYGGSLADGFRLVGVYTGRILKGDKPADLPVQQITKVELIVNLKTAKALGLAVPPSLLARADEVIE